ncbi:MAG: cytochrome c [Bacteroidales bacterium]|nr:cytochrome c [Bacteroidales bacterium]
MDHSMLLIQKKEEYGELFIPDKSMKVRCFLAIFMAIMMLVSCKNNTTVPETNTDSGLAVYKQNCLSCHQSDGSGVPNMYPPLINTEWVTKNNDRLISLILNGISGEIEVNGVKYNSVMPAFDYLTNKQVADVLTYIRSNFGNNAQPITPEEVQQIREIQKK